jgi:MGT family glycosyltransferase
MAPHGLFFGFPARSHTLPSLSLVRELAAHDVRLSYYSTSNFRSLIESNGAQFVSYPESCDILSEPADLFGHVSRVVDITAEILPHLLGGIVEPPEFVVFDGSALWGQIISEEYRATSVASITTFAFTRSMVRLLGGSQRDDARLNERILELNRCHLRDFADVIAPLANFRIIYTSRFFQPGGRFFDDTHFFVGPQVGGRPHEGGAIAFSGSKPLAYISFGTIFNRDVGLLRNISDILLKAGWAVIVSLGDPNAQVPGDWPPDVQVYSFVDQIAVLSRVRLFVTHGGMGGVSEALANGIPLIVVPQSVDQFLVARRVVELRAGIMIDADAPRDEWELALNRLLGNEQQFVTGARQIQQSFAADAAVSDVVPRILKRAPGVWDAVSN